MDRNEAVLRELNLYPLWQRRGAPAPAVAEPHAPVMAKEDTAAPVAVDIPSPLTPSDGAASRSTGRRSGQVAGCPASERGTLDKHGWPELKAMVRDCTACRLRAGCTQAVFGVGDEQADWLFVGEGPGADEDARGEPFVGQAGKLLDNMLLAIKLRRGKNVYIANIVKCRPPNNRAPEADEIAACLPYLQRQIELINPRLIVALGKTAANALLGHEAPLGSLRGRLHDYRGVPLVVTYHPAYLLRSPMEKAKAWQDLCAAVRAFPGDNTD